MTDLYWMPDKSSIDRNWMTLLRAKRLGSRILPIAAAVFLTAFAQASNAPDMEGEPTSFWGDIVFVEDGLREHEGIVSKMKINVCDYGSRSFDELEMLVKEEALGTKSSDMSELFSNVPVYERTKAIDPELQRLTGIRAASVLYLSFECNVSDGNKNRWTLHAQSFDDGALFSIDLYLSYLDDDFAKRNEHISKERYGRYDDVVRAIASLVNAQSYDRILLRRDMITGEFWHLLSCESDDTISDVFYLPPPPNSVPGLLGVFIIPDPQAEVVASFSKEDGKFVGVTSRYRRPVNEKCTWIDKSYDGKLIGWIVEDYPDSWFVEYLDPSK